MDTPERRKSEEEEIHLRQMYRDVFSTDTGSKVLFSILSDLGLFTEAKDIDRVALRNYATFLIRQRIGLNDASGMMAVLKAILAKGK